MMISFLLFIIEKFGLNFNKYLNNLFTFNMLGNKSFTKFDTQLLLGVLITIFGLALITLSFFVKPVGYIDPTVLTAFGEILTFAGALLGIDANYRIHIHRIKHKDGREELYTDQGDINDKKSGE